MKRARVRSDSSVAAPGVAHAAAQPADELVDDLAERAGVGDAALDALGHQLAAAPRRRADAWPLA